MKRTKEPEVMDLPEEAAAYAQADFSAVNQAFVESLLVHAGRREYASALDLGTGPADIPIRLAAARALWRITAVDASAAMLDLARANVARAAMGDRIVLLQADAKNIPLPAGSFDVIFSNSILHHIGNVAPFWAQVKRLAADGATVFLRDLARPDSPRAARDLVDRYAASETKLLQEEYYRSLLAAFTVEEVQRQLRKAGLALKVRMASDRHLDVFGTVDRCRDGTT